MRTACCSNNSAFSSSHESPGMRCNLPAPCDTYHFRVRYSRVQGTSLISLRRHQASPSPLDYEDAKEVKCWVGVILREGMGGL
jgi:hypothetical protein